MLPIEEQHRLIAEYLTTYPKPVAMLLGIYPRRCHLARKFGLENEELEAIAMEAVVVAASQFSEEKGASFSTYVGVKMGGCLSKAISRDQRDDERRGGGRVVSACDTNDAHGQSLDLGRTIEDESVEAHHLRIERGEEMDRVRRAMSEVLDPRETLVFNLIHLQEMQLKDVASHIGMTRASVSNILRSALQKIRRRLGVKSDSDVTPER